MTERKTHGQHLRGMLLAAALLPAAAGAQLLSDPTRPPDAAEAQGAVASAGPVVQSIVIGPGRKRAAIIGGERVEVGGSYGGAAVVRITDAGVFLKGSEGETFLPASVGVEKTPSKRKDRK
ncbi:MAG: hypothetical protein BroJett006_23790 [Betaproteobacteria bacterium]|nr:MAG: hypothetical protein BroJett006_23790 [Betaproteobacteria bacterium]